MRLELLDVGIGLLWLAAIVMFWALAANATRGTRR